MQATWPVLVHSCLSRPDAMAECGGCGGPEPLRLHGVLLRQKDRPSRQRDALLCSQVLRQLLPQTGKVSSVDRI